MSKSFQLVNGDLQVERRGFTIVHAQDKLVQDLTLWIREKVGTDPMTPTFGSTLDGAIINGVETPTFIGQIVSPQTQAQIASVLTNLLQRYQTLQLQKMRDEAITYSGRHTLEASEVISSIDEIKVTNVGTTILAQITLTTLANSQLQFAFPIGEQ